MHFPSQLFKSAGLNSTDVANLVGVSRITGYRWLQGTNRATGADGVGVNVFLQDKVSRLVAPLTEAVANGALPNEDVQNLEPKKRAARIRAIINQYRSKK